MTTIAISSLRANIMEFIKKVMNGEEIMITSRGRQVAMLVPSSCNKERALQQLGKLSTSCKIGDIVSPIINHPWKASK